VISPPDPQPEEIMPHDYEDAINLDQLSDGDVRDLVRQRLDEAEDFDIEAADVEVAAGRIRVEGRVGTEGERQHVAQVLTALGATGFENNVVVDRLARAERSEAADQAALEEDAAGSVRAPGEVTSDTADHLLPDERSELHGTRDVQKAVEGGRSYDPPDGPLQEGAGEGERH
jgi:hypothetical protein